MADHGWRLGMGCLWVAGLLAGCNAQEAFLSSGFDRADIGSARSACSLAPSPNDASTLIVLDWTGGASDQVIDAALGPFDGDALDLPAAEADADDRDAMFQAAVLTRVQTILCDLDPMDLAVIIGEAEDYPGATIVHITGDAPPAGGKHVGQSHFDPCNEDPDDAAVIWGGALAARIPASTFEHWVNVFANTTAHEIGHTLGFAHPSEESVARLLPVPSAEIMRANVKAGELMGEQNFLLEQETCPGHAAGDGSYALSSVIDDGLGG